MDRVLNVEFISSIAYDGIDIDWLEMRITISLSSCLKYETKSVFIYICMCQSVCTIKIFNNESLIASSSCTIEPIQ